MPYPGFGDQAGFITSVVIMVTTAVVLFIIFKVKKWLTSLLVFVRMSVLGRAAIKTD